MQHNVLDRLPVISTASCTHFDSRLTCHCFSFTHQSWRRQ